MMKRYLMMILVLTCLLNLNAYAISVNNIGFKRIYTETRSGSSPVNISITSKGEAAIGFRNKRINVYDGDGNFKWGYEFQTSGSYAFKFDDEDNIVIISVRSDLYYTFNQEGELLSVSEKPDSYKEYIQLKSTRSINMNGYRYSLENRLGLTEFYRTNINGDKQELYKISAFHLIGKILIVALGVIFFIVVALLSIKGFKFSTMRPWKD